MGRYVLIVDDDQAIRESLRLALEDAEYIVLEAADGVSALATLRTHAASDRRLVVLLDMMMPGLDGPGVLGVVSGDHRLARSHAFILVTAAHTTFPLAFANLLTNLGVPVIAKPFDIETLFDAIESAARRLE